MGDLEVCTPVCMESLLGYHSFDIEILTLCRYPVEGHCQVGSLTGAVASERVTEAFKGWLSTVRNRAFECKRISQPDCETDKSSRNESWS